VRLDWPLLLQYQRGRELSGQVALGSDVLRQRVENFRVDSSLYLPPDCSHTACQISRYEVCFSECVADARARGWRHRLVPLARLSLAGAASHMPEIPPDQTSFSSHLALFTNQTRTRAARPWSSFCSFVTGVNKRLQTCKFIPLSLQQPPFRRCCEVGRTTSCHFGLDRTGLRSLWHVRAWIAALS
jgi:hypothetical protein